MTTSHRQHLASWGVAFAGLAFISWASMRVIRACIWDATPPPSTIVFLADVAPLQMWLFKFGFAFCSTWAAFCFVLALTRRNQAECPHCNRQLEPRITAVGRIILRPRTREPIDDIGA